MNKKETQAEIAFYLMEIVFKIKEIEGGESKVEVFPVSKWAGKILKIVNKK